MKFIAALPVVAPAAQQISKVLQCTPPLNFAIQPNGEFNKCYWNVIDHCAEHGGSPVYGWKLQTFNLRFVEAVHHAVWETEEGELIDVTEPGPSYDSNSGVTFCVDPFWEWGEDFLPAIPNKFFSVFHPNDPNFVDLNILDEAHINRIEYYSAIAKERGLIQNSRYDFLIMPDEQDELNRLFGIEIQIRSDFSGLALS